MYQLDPHVIAAQYAYRVERLQLEARVSRLRRERRHRRRIGAHWPPWSEGTAPKGAGLEGTAPQGAGTGATAHA